MKYDVCIIGGGSAGLINGIRCAEAGLRTVIISGGMNSLHFSSGSFDLLSYDTKGNPLEEPFPAIARLKKEKPHHPYSKMSLPVIKKALTYTSDQCRKGGLELSTNGERNHPRLTAAGLMKQTYLSQPTVFSSELKEAFTNKEPMKLLNFEGYRDYFAEMALGVMKKDKQWDGYDISMGTINLPSYVNDGKNIHEYRSTDLARIFDTERFLPRIAQEIRKAAGDARIISLPAFIGINNYSLIHKKLEEMTGCLIYEIPTLPPSILGLRLDKALKDRYAALGGEISLGDHVTGGELSGKNVEYIYTKNYGSVKHTAKAFVLASGSFFSNGLKSDISGISEPIFGLKVDAPSIRTRWYNREFFSKKGHPFMEYGVETGKGFNALSSKGKPLSNLYAIGSVLSGYDPIKEGSGGGVAITTGFAVAEKIIASLGGKK